LPPGVAARDPVRSNVSAAVDDWSGRWFAKRRPRLSEFEAVAGAPRSEDAGWLVFRAAIAVACNKSASSRLTNWALDAGPEPLEPTETDQELMASFRRQMLDDLLQTVEAALGITGSGPAAPTSVKNPFWPTGGALATVSDDRGSPLLQLAIPSQAVMALCRMSLPARSPAGVPLSPMRGALNDEIINVEATLGAVELPLQDLRRLTPGDIVVLDRALIDPIDLSVCDSGEVIGRATLNEVDGRIALTLHA
jgi:flagellar motor switch/type III secretory pathway protein FliN